MAKRARKKRVEEDLGRKLVGYSIAAGAALAVGTNADAVLVKTSIDRTATLDNSVMIDLDGDEIPDFEVSVVSNAALEVFIHGVTVEPGFVGPLIADGKRVIAVTGVYPYAAKPFVTSSSINFGVDPFFFRAELSFSKAMWAGLAIGSNFGGALINIGPGHSSATVISTVFETAPGVSAHLEPIPEPGTLALLATGAAGLMALRRRQRRTEPETESPS